MPLTELFSSFKRKTETLQCNTLNVEALEDRIMLSTVEIFAAGATGQENLELFIDGEFQQTFFQVGGDASTGNFQRFTFESDQALTPGDIGIGFANDAFDSSIGLDRNLFVDRIVVDGVTVEAEDPSTFSTGIFRGGSFTGPGFLQTDVLNINGILTFADPGSGLGGNDRIEFDASGTTGEEFVEVFVSGESVAFFNLSTETQTFSLTANDTDVSIEDIRLEFINDLFDPSSGIDRNAQIDEFRVVDGATGEVTTARTTDANVLSSGIFVSGTGITEGFGAGGFIVSDFGGGNGFVQVSGPGSGGGSIGTGDRIEFDALGTTGEEFVDILVNGQNVAFFGLENAGVTETFSFISPDSDISIEDIRLEFVNDLFDPSRGIDRNVQIFEYRVIDGETGEVTTARTTDANVLNSGIFVDGTGITQGFGAGGFIAGNFDGNGFVEIRGDDGGDSGTGSFVLDSSFQVTENIRNLDPAVGPSDQIASAEFFGSEIFVVGSDGAPLAGFGNDGLVDIRELFDVPSVTVTDLEFFDDGSLLITGNALTPPPTPGPGSRTPFIAKLTPDGTLDQSFVQQGALNGTFFEFDSFGNPDVSDILSSIDSQGRIVLLSTNTIPGEPVNYVVSRLNADGSIDSTFGNSGNVFISGSSFESATASGAALPLFVDTLDNGEITFAFEVQTGDELSLVVSRLSADGSVDQSFANNGFFVRPDTSDASLAATPDGGVAIGFTNFSAFVDDAPFATLGTPTVLLLNADGDISAEVLVTPSAGDISTSPSFIDVRAEGLAVNSSGEIFLQSSRGSFSDSVVRVAPSGVVDSEFFFNGTIFGLSNEIIFDSNDRLVVVGQNISRFEST